MSNSLLTGNSRVNLSHNLDLSCQDEDFYVYGVRMRAKSKVKNGLQKISVIAVPGNDTHPGPCAWNGKRLWVMTSEYYNELRGKPPR